MDMSHFPLRSPFDDGALNVRIGRPVLAASTVDLTHSDGNVIHVVAPSIVTVNKMIIPRGATRLLYFESQVQLAHSTTQVMPGSTTVTTTAGDWAEVVNDAGVIRLTQFMRANGQPASSDPNAVPLSGGTMTGLLNLKGTTTNDSAATGIVGEYVTSSVGVGSPITLAAAVNVNITSISLTTGDWDVSGNISFQPGGTVAYVQGGISTTSNTLAGANNNFSISAALTATVDTTVPLHTVRISIAGTTTVYLVANASFGTSMVAYGHIRARRVR